MAFVGIVVVAVLAVEPWPLSIGMRRILRPSARMYAYLPCDEGKLYLATVEDLASRRLPGFSIGEHHDAALAKAALCMAAAVRGGDITGVIFHTDKGGEYAGDTFAKTCLALGVVQSMGRVGSALDNAA